jgi:Ca-activated chloride channel homolog
MALHLYGAQRSVSLLAPLFSTLALVACNTTSPTALEKPAAPSAASKPASGYAAASVAPGAAAAPAPAPAPVPAPAYAMQQPLARMVAPQALPAPAAASTAQYQLFADTLWQRVAETPVSTFSADVDTGSYANVRRFINRGQLPPRDAVRVEELVNYFGYQYNLPAPEHAHPFAVHTQVMASPWHSERNVVRIGIQGKDVAKTSLPPANLVFLVDVSGSMGPQDRLPLVKSSLKLLATQLRAKDRVSLVSYANGTKLVLPPTAGDQRDTIHAAIDTLVASGGTYGEAGIRMAYVQARQSFIQGGINRVLLATDGDLNIGVTDRNELKALVEAERKHGVSLTTLGVGDSNYNEALMKTLANVGDGSYHYLDSLQEAHKVLVNQFTSNLAPIAQDLKIQIEFNPLQVQEYRLLGYELRALTREQFNDDKVDAGDIGAGHSVTAMYEIVPIGARGNVDPLRYRAPVGAQSGAPTGATSTELAWVKLRYKDPGQTVSKLIEQPVAKLGSQPSLDSADTDARFALAVAAWGQWLRGNTLIGDYGTDKVLALARGARGADTYGHRAEFVRLVELSATLKR